MPKPCSTSHPNKSLLDRLGVYAVAATAAGVAVLAATEPAEADVVFTPARIQISAGTTSLDLNNDGIPDFNFVRQSTYLGREGFSSTVVTPVNPVNRIEGDGRIKFFGHGTFSAFALPAGSVVGPKVQAFHPSGQKFMRGSWFVLGTGNLYRSLVGAWANGVKGVADRYLGLAFTISGETHFGWARLSVPPLNHLFEVGTNITGYAYETVPLKAITTGPQQSGALRILEPRFHQSQTPVHAQAQVLGALALGYGGLSIWRRENDVVSSAAPEDQDV
jgi:hypothetical protein